MIFVVIMKAELQMPRGDLRVLLVLLNDSDSAEFNGFV